MLDPQDRRLLLDSLRPPDGYRLESAVATTYTLDLLTLLTTPLAFTLFDWEDEDGRPNLSPTLLLEALRRHADQLTVFCQAGRISVPSQHQRLFSYLEGSVVEVVPPHPEASFHPKVWVLRFEREGGAPTRYRLLCLTRNLTPDRCWDASLVLDGTLAERKVAFAVNHPLADFVQFLPQLALRPVSERIASQVARMANELRRVDFDLPEEFESIKFWPLGIPRYTKWPFGGRVDRSLVVSPFLSADVLARLSPGSPEHVLVSREEELDRIDSDTLGRFAKVYVLNPAVAFDPDTAEKAVASNDFLTGLHAKLYVTDAGWDASVWVGSANATNAAFTGNVEFLVELVGKKSRCGIEQLLARIGDSEQPGFAALLQLYQRQERPAVDPIVEQLEKAIELAGRDLAAISWTARAAALEGETRYALRLERDAKSEISLPAGTRVRCWPVMLAESASVTLDFAVTTAATFEVSLETLTSFFAFELSAEESGRTCAKRLVLNVPLSGAPAGRRAGIVRSLLRDRGEVAKLLLLLLGEMPHDPVDEPAASAALDRGSPSASSAPSRPLLELLVGALGNDPSRLDEIAGLVRDLDADHESAQLLPERFSEIWQAVWAARERLRT